MTLGTRLLCAASAMLALTVALRASELVSGPSPQAPHLRQGFGGQAAQAIQTEFVGSASCERCHVKEHAQWKDSLHIKMTKPIADATIVGDFSEGTTFADHDRAYTFGRRNGKPFVTVTFGQASPETFSVDYTLGSKRYQGYLSMLPEGRMYVLPIFWHVEYKRWMDWKEITPIPDGAHDIRQIWNVNCFNCHATNIVQGYNVAARRYDTSWTEMGIGCEACHGPGREHNTLMEAWEKNPALKPAYDTSDNNRGLSDTLKILSTRSSDPKRTFDTCAYCHGNKNNVFVGFKAGDRYTDFAMPFLISEPVPANDHQGEFWPDGRPNRFNRPQALSMSGCFKAGAISCASCHLSHGSTFEASLKVDIHDGRKGDELCTQCHSSPPPTPRLRGTSKPVDSALVPASYAGAGLQQHTFHAPQSEGSRCINCHMSDVNWRLLIRKRDHTFQAPVPENTARFGIPNACTTCHDERSPEWAARQMNEWWGDGERRGKSVTLADTMYRAGSGDVETLPALARLAVDRSQGLLVRASAAEYIARLISEGRSDGAQRTGSMQSQTAFAGATGATGAKGATGASGAKGAVAEVTPAIVNALIGAADDPEPVVRAAALRALGTIGDRERALAPVLARLVDSSRVVRARAAEVLVAFGVVQLPGGAGDALRQAQDDYILSLDTFPDVASNHASKGWLEAERGNAREALAALDQATLVEPNYAFPWVVKGVMSARQGRFADAVEMWKKARSIEPSYPNINQLITEAEKRKN
jgi:predicted CXXCH cytochrome family protein